MSTLNDWREKKASKEKRTNIIYFPKNELDQRQRKQNAIAIHTTVKPTNLFLKDEISIFEPTFGIYAWDIGTTIIMEFRNNHRRDNGGKRGIVLPAIVRIY